MSHTHLGDSSLTHMRLRQKRILWITLAGNSAFMVVEILAGIVFGSLVLLADGLHMVTDVIGLALATTAVGLVMRPPTDRFSFGLSRSEVLAALANGVLLISAAVFICVEAIDRFGQTEHVDGGPVLIVAALGLTVNLVSAGLLMRVRGESLNIRGAFLHMAVDAIGSVGAIIVGLSVLFWNTAWLDSVMAMLVGLLSLVSGLALIRSATRILLEGTPGNLDPTDIKSSIMSMPAVDAVHHLHMWSIASDQTAMSAHVVFEGVDSLHAAETHAAIIKSMLQDQYQIDHATLELECHPCDEPPC